MNVTLGKCEVMGTGSTVSGLRGQHLNHKSIMLTGENFWVISRMLPNLDQTIYGHEWINPGLEIEWKCNVMLASYPRS